MPDIIIQPLKIAERAWVSEFMLEHWGSNMVVSRGVVYYPQDIPGFVAMYYGEKVGLVTYNPHSAVCICIFRKIAWRADLQSRVYL
jgi:hypothetical protein